MHLLGNFIYYPNNILIRQNNVKKCEVVPPRVELGSLAPMANVIDRYITGLDMVWSAVSSVLY